MSKITFYATDEEKKKILKKLLAVLESGECNFEYYNGTYTITCNQNNQDLVHQIIYKVHESLSETVRTLSVEDTKREVFFELFDSSDLVVKLKDSLNKAQMDVLANDREDFFNKII